MYLGMRIVWGQRVMWEMVIRVDFDMSAVPQIKSEYMVMQSLQHRLQAA
jgi:hypothetical protein